MKAKVDEFKRGKSVKRKSLKILKVLLRTKSREGKNAPFARWEDT